MQGRRQEGQQPGGRKQDIRPDIRTADRTPNRQGERQPERKGSLGLARSSLHPLPALKCIPSPFSASQPLAALWAVRERSCRLCSPHHPACCGPLPPRPNTPGLDINAAIVTNMVYQEALMYPVPTFLPAIYRAPLGPGPGLVIANSSIFTLCTTLQAYVQYVQVNAPRSFTVRAGGGWCGEEVRVGPGAIHVAGVRAVCAGQRAWYLGRPLRVVQLACSHSLPTCSEVGAFTPSLAI